MNKKAIAILGAIFLLIVGTLGFLIYTKYSGNKTDTAATTTPVTIVTPPPPTPPVPATTTPTPPPIQPVPTSTPPSNQYDVVKLTSSQVVSPVLFYNGTGITYFDNQGNLFQANLVDSNGQLTFTRQKQLDIPLKANITKILWPPKGDDFIAESTNAAGKTTWSYFNSAAGEYVDLPPQVESVDWMPSGKEIVYVWVENDKASLNISNPDTTNWRAVGDMWENDDSVHVSPNGSQIIYYETDN
ncbi:MAG TPA: hypothetical protein VE973_01270, partial [Candidatus Limnocylindria bacterium]|nr:hypothetical protein [Candidatus Limnocylindria bacterium]